MIKADFSFTLCVCGDSDTGKSSLLSSMVGDESTEAKTSNTMGMLYPITVEFDGISVRLNIWDTSGEHDYEEMSATHFSTAQGVIYLYSVDNKKSLNHVISYWKDQIDKESLLPHEAFLVGTKSDLSVKVDQKLITEVANGLKTTNFFVSAYDQSGVTELVTNITKRLVENQKPAKKPINEPQQRIIKNIKNRNSIPSSNSIEFPDLSDIQKHNQKKRKYNPREEETNCGCNVA